MARKKSTTRKKSGSKKAAATLQPTPDKRIYVLAGKDEYLRHLITVKIREAVEAACGEIEYTRYDGAETNLADVLDECRSFGLMQQHKLIVLDRADQLIKEDARPPMERYAAAPSDHATLILRADTWRAGKLDAHIEAVGAIVKCEEATPGQAIKWAVNRAEKHHKAELRPDAAEALVDRVGADLGRIDSELSKLAAAAGEEAITADHVRDLVGATREEIGWALQAAILSGDAEHAMKTLERIRIGGKNVEVFCSIVLVDLAQKLHAAARLIQQQGVPPFRAAGQLRLFGAARDPILEAARRLSPQDLADLFDIAVDADVRMKSGLASQRRVVEAVTLRFASVVR